MSRALYYSIQFVTLHQKKPTDLPNSTSSKPFLSIRGTDTPYSKYGLVFGFSDPGENSYGDQFDYPEFRIESASFIKPTGFDSEKIYYTSEDINGSFYTNITQKWRVFSVPDNFIIPPEISEANGNYSTTGAWSSITDSNGQLLFSNSPSLELNSTTLGISRIEIMIGMPIRLETPWASIKNELSKQLRDELLYVMQNAAQTVGLGNIYETLTKAGELSSALANFTNNATTAFQSMMNNFDSMSIEESQDLTDKLLQTSYKDFIDLAQSEFGVDSKELSIIKNIQIAVDAKRNANGTSSVIFSVHKDLTYYQMPKDGIAMLITGYLSANSPSVAITSNAFVYGSDINDNYLIYKPSSQSNVPRKVVVHGGGGDDFFGAQYASFNSTLYGGTGNDNYVINSIFGTAIEAPNEGIDNVTILNGIQSYFTPENIENVFFTPQNSTNSRTEIKGNNLDNEINFYSYIHQEVSIDGGGGADTLIGSGGNDIMTGGDGNDTFKFTVNGNGIDLITDLVSGDKIVIETLLNPSAPTPGNGANLTRKSVQVSSTTDLTSLWIDTDGFSGVDTRIDLTGSFAANQFVVTNHTDGTASISLHINTVPTGAVSITVTSTGQTLTAAHTLADADGMGTLSYQWLVNGSAISGATASTFTLTDAQLNQSISLRTSYTDVFGALESQTSNVARIGTAVMDEMVGTTGADFFYGRDGGDWLFGNDGADVMQADAGNDYLFGQNGRDTLNGGDGADIVSGGADDDVLYAGIGDDGALGNEGNDTLYGEGGGDFVAGGDDNDVLYGGDGQDWEYGEWGNDVLYGDVGNDFLFGNFGNDTFVGGTGNDTFFLGEGADRVMFSANQGEDFITDFSVAQGDKLIITSGTAGITTTDQALAHAYASGNNTIVDFGGTTANYVVLIGTPLSALHASDFVIA